MESSDYCHCQNNVNGGGKCVGDSVIPVVRVLLLWISLPLQYSTNGHKHYMCGFSELNNFRLSINDGISGVSMSGAK